MQLVSTVVSGNHPDLVAVEPEGRASLGVDTARSMVTQAVLSPVESQRRVFLVDDAGLMTEQAANAMLKTLEEPTAVVTFLIVSESDDDFPPTVASRCRVIRFGRVPEAELTEALTERGMEAEEARVLAMVSGGRPGLALQLGPGSPVAELRRGMALIAGSLQREAGRRLQLGRGDDDGDRTSGWRDCRRLGRRCRTARPGSPPGNPVTLGLRPPRSWRRSTWTRLRCSWVGRSGTADVPLAELTRVSPAEAVSGAHAILDAVIDLSGTCGLCPFWAALFTSLGLQEPS